MEMRNVRVVGHIVFSGDLDIPPDPDAAEIALRRAGYTVVRLPERLQSRVAVPGDDFVWAYVNVAIADQESLADAIVGVIMDEINGIVDGHGGTCMECGAEPPDYEPASEFDAMFEVPPRRH
jgi:hypothetical protein